MIVGFFKLKSNLSAIDEFRPNIYDLRTEKYELECQVVFQTFRLIENYVLFFFGIADNYADFSYQLFRAIS